jgi:4-diphosphocytidyl-2-C-methyl-D-erythritol kinase
MTMPSMNTGAGAPTTVFAPAKLTRTLRITGVRDDGYHLIDAEMVTLELADELVIDPSGTGLSAEGPFAAGVPLDDGNLVAKALRLAGRRAHVRLVKRIPHGGGLGGGSADAAAVLRWAGYGATTDELVAASKLGADIPFCIRGGRARVRGIGELLDPMPPVALDLTLIVPPLAVSTPAAYRAWDALGGPTAEGPNDLEPAAIAVVPELARWRDRIAEIAGLTPVLAGSGATWFVDGHHPELRALEPDATVVFTGTRA